MTHAAHAAVGVKVTKSKRKRGNSSFAKWGIAQLAVQFFWGGNGMGVSKEQFLFES